MIDGQNQLVISHVHQAARQGLNSTIVVSVGHLDAPTCGTMRGNKQEVDQE